MGSDERLAEVSEKFAGTPGSTPSGWVTIHRTWVWPHLTAVVVYWGRKRCQFEKHHTRYAEEGESEL